MVEKREGPDNHKQTYQASCNGWKTWKREGLITTKPIKRLVVVEKREGPDNHNQTYQTIAVGEEVENEKVW